MGRGVSDSHQELARELGQAQRILPVLASYQADYLYHQYGRRISPPAPQGDQEQGRVHFGYRLGKTCLSRIYENTEEVDSAGPELGPDSAAAGHPLPRPVQDTGLKRIFYLEFFEGIDKFAASVGGHGRLR